MSERGQSRFKLRPLADLRDRAAQSSRVTILGIDPGVNGALAWLVNDQFHALADMPTFTTTVGGQARKRVDARLLACTLREMPYPTYTVIEEVHAMPPRGGRRAGSQSSFNFGASVGKIHGVLDALDWPYVQLTSNVWKRAWGLIGKPKQAALDLARETYPEAQGFLTRKMDVDRADAVLLAGYVFER